MITGLVLDLEASIHLRVRGPRGRERRIEVLVDTGYTGYLTLPPLLVATLGLRWQTSRSGVLADGTECLFDVYEAAVIWDRRLRPILVDQSDAIPLVGMSLLKGYELNMQVRHRGRVAIKRLA